MDPINSLFYRGLYNEALKHQFEISNLNYYLGSLSFIGRIDEALELLKQFQQKIKTDILIECRFYLAIGLIRNSRYFEGRQLLIENLKCKNKTKNEKSLFFIHQGPAFYRYFCGRWNLGISSSILASTFALKSNFTYGRMLADDVRGHLLIQLEDVDQGLSYLRKAKELALELNNTTVFNAINISIITYEAQFGFNLKDSLSLLQKEKIKTSKQDTYSQASLLLEISRQLLLRSRLFDVIEVLNEASFLIYLYKNRRQEAQLNLRWSEYYFQKGEFFQSLSAVQSAQRSLDPEVDRALNLACLGMQLKITNQLSLPEKMTPLKNEIAKQSLHFAGNIHKRILYRLDPDFFNERPPERGDRLSKLIDNSSLKEKLDSGLYSLAFKEFNINRKDKCILIDVIKDYHFIYAEGEIYRLPKLTPLMKKILLSLIDGEKSKEVLLNLVWGHAYDPLRHDSLIHSSIVTTRKALGPFGRWIETIEDGYQLKNIVKIRSLQSAHKKLDITHQTPIIDLNSRQLEFLKSLQSQTFINVRDYQKLFHISQITACRDLANLCQKGYLVKVARARATRYARPEGVIK